MYSDHNTPIFFFVFLCLYEGNINAKLCVSLPTGGELATGYNSKT